MLTFRLDLGVSHGHLAATIRDARLNNQPIDEQRVATWNERIANRLERASRRNPNSTLQAVRIMARIVAPIATRLPFEWLYPTGDKQSQVVPKWEKYYRWASAIAGDFHYVKRHMPASMDGKVVVTNTTTLQDVQFLRNRDVAWLVTTTPRLVGRSCGTKVMEGVLVALAGKGRPLEEYEIQEMLARLDYAPSIEKL